MPFPSVERHSQKQAQEQAFHEAIAIAAYYKWEAAGRPHRKDRDFWFEAESEFTSADVAITEVTDNQL